MNILQKKQPVSFLQMLRKRSNYACKTKNESALMLLLVSSETFHIKHGLTKESLLLQGKLYLQLGIIKKDQKSLELAIQNFERIFKKSPSKQIYYYLAKAFFYKAKTTKDRNILRKSYLYFQKAKGLKSTEFFDDYCEFIIEYAKQLNRSKLLLDATSFFSNPKHLVLIYQKHYEMTLEPSSIVNGSYYLQKAKKDAQAYLIWARFLKAEGLLSDNPDKLLEALKKIDIALMEKASADLYQESILIGCYYTLMTDNFEGIVIARKRMDLLRKLTPRKEDLYSAFLLLTEGNYFQDKNKIQIAISKLETILHKDPTNGFIWQALAIGYFDQHKINGDINCLEKAHFCFERHCLLKPYCLRARMDVAISSHLLANYTQNQKLLEKSLTLYEHAINAASNLSQLSTPILFHYGNALDLYGDFTRDQAVYLRASLVFGGIVQVHPENPSFRLALAKTLCHLGEVTNQASWFNEAISHFKILMKENPCDEEMLLEYACALMNISCLTDKNSALHLANKLLKKALLLGNEGACYYLACNHSLIGELDLAVSYLEKTKELNMLPSSFEMSQDSWLDNLREVEAFKRL